jgi:hypothetical protein
VLTQFSPLVLIIDKRAFIVVLTFPWQIILLMENPPHRCLDEAKLHADDVVDYIGGRHAVRRYKIRCAAWVHVPPVFSWLTAATNIQAAIGAVAAGNVVLP